MWKTHFVILTLLYSECLSVVAFQDGTEATSGTERRDRSMLGLLSGNGLYNPMDPMGFIFEGNSKQFTGNGVDTPRFDPDNFAYRYAGTTFGSGVKPFVSNFISSQSINSSPIYAQILRPTKRPTDDHNVTNIIEERNETKTDEHTFSELPVADGSYPSGAFSEFTSQTFPENIMSTLKINASNMFPGLKFSGQPGMLGIGSQVPVQTVIPEAGPVPDQQYLPAALRNVSETRILSSAYNRYPGMEGDKLQTSSVTNRIHSSTPKPLYNGYPGMLGVGQMIKYIGNNVNEPTNKNGGVSSKGLSNKDQPSYQNSVGHKIGNTFISARPAGVNANSWKGEWPGKTAAGGDWSGDWSEKWPKSNSPTTEDKEDTLASKFGTSASQPSSSTDWDGSWPGSAEKTESTTRLSNNFGDLGETMAALQKLINMLNNIPASVDNSDDNKATPKSFSQMVSSWKEEMKS